MLGQPLVVSCVAAGVDAPAHRPLDFPAAGQRGEALGAFGPGNDAQGEPEALAGPARGVAGVAAVGPNLGDLGLGEAHAPEDVAAAAIYVAPYDRLPRLETAHRSPVPAGKPEAAALEASGIDEPVRHGAQVVAVRGDLRQAAGLLPGRAADEPQRQAQAAGRLLASPQQESELDDQVEQRRADFGAVQGVPGEGVAHARGGGQGARGDGAGLDPAGAVRGQPSGAASQDALLVRGHCGPTLMRISETSTAARSIPQTSSCFPVTKGR